MPLKKNFYLIGSQPACRYRRISLIPACRIDRAFTLYIFVLIIKLITEKVLNILKCVLRINPVPKTETSNTAKPNI